MSTSMELGSGKKESKKRKLRNPLTFLGQVKEELKRVSWTTKKELISSTKIVVVATFLFGIGIYVVDLGIKGILDSIKKLVLLLVG